jgi:glutathione S-transferase
MSTPRLSIFAISHYCEKARWALDFYGFEYAVQYLAPGLHGRYAKRLGLPVSSLPILEVDDEVIQGSSAIIDWAEKHTMREVALCREQPAAVAATEQRLDAIIGVQIRRYFYSEALVSYPHTVRPIFTRDLTGMSRLFVLLAWSRIRGMMIARMDLGPAQQEDACTRIEAELDWLDDLLADGRTYLHGSALSRADITAASLIGPLVQPPDLDVALQLPPRVSADLVRWRERPVLQWVERIYREHRDCR